MTLGGLEWARATSGRLSASERRALLAPILGTTLRYTRDRLRLALGLRRDAIPGLDPDAIAIPDSRLVQEAERECRETLTPAMANHSYRSFLFGLALASLDRVELEVEHLYAACLLHDIALESPSSERCFAVAGAERVREVATRAGVDAKTGESLAEAVALHITPGIGYERGPLAPTIAAGAMVDLLGLRLCDVPADYVEHTLARHPRHGCTQHLAACWRREAEAFPEGRAALVERFARFSLFLRLSPFPE